MRIGHVVISALILGACGAEDFDSLVGVWSVEEEVSNQVYELEFLQDGTVRQVVQGHTNHGSYTFHNNDGLGELLITWSNGSQSLNWVQPEGRNLIALYGDRDEERRGVVSTSKRAELSRH